MVKKLFSKTWLRSVQPRKQRKYRHNAPLHVKQKMVHVHLSSELRAKYHFRNVQVRKGDKVKIMRGKYKKKEGVVEKVNLKREKVFVAGIEIIRQDGTKVPLKLSPSNLLIVDLNLSDKKRKQKLGTKQVQGKSKIEENREQRKEPQKQIKKEVKTELKEVKEIRE